MTLFEKIAAGEIPAKIIQEDEDLIVFHDINPQAPIHVLVVPKKPIPRLTGATKEDGKLLGDLLLKAQEIAKSLGIAESGFRVVINNGRNGGETVPHLHVHLLGGRPFAWPPG
jgi:histidine triad (HIT) family protein